MKKRIINSIIELSKTDYVGSVLQVLNIYENNEVCPTMGVFFDKKTKTFNLIYNDNFIDKLTNDNLIAVLRHEVEHIIRKHLLHTDNPKYKNHQLRNCAMDIAINQHIPNLPEGALYLDTFKTKEGNPLPPGQTWTTYYELIEQNEENFQKKQDSLDDHSQWKDEEANPEDLKEATKNLLKRANNLEEKKHGKASQTLNDILSDLIKSSNKRLADEVLKNSLRNTLPGIDIKKTWTKPSRRYGSIAKGNKVKELPKVKMYWDTSGSMSYEEINKSLNLMTGMIETGCKKIDLGLFHQSLYLSNKSYKKGVEFKKEDIQVGGTDLTETLTDIINTNYDLYVITTDGYYDRCKNANLLKGMNKNIVFVLSVDNPNHPLYDLGKNIRYEKGQ